MFTSQPPSRAGSRRPVQAPLPRTLNASVNPLAQGSRAGSHLQHASGSRYGTPPTNVRPFRGGNIRQGLHDADGDFEMQSERSAPVDLTARHFVKRPELSVVFSGQLPLEVQSVIKTIDFHQNAYSGHVDSATNFSFVVSATTCFVWNTSQNTQGSSTCYIFPVPLAAQSESVLPPSTSLVPYGGTREPGLIIISATGEVRFWESIGTGLAGAERFVSAQISLVSEELITGIYRCDNLVYIASSTFGRLFRLTISTSSGKSQVICTTFTRSQSVFARVTSTLFATGTTISDTGSISAVAVSGESIRQGKDVWALSERQLQKWRVSLDSWEQLEAEHDLNDLLGQTVFEKLPKKEFFSRNLDMEFLDVGVRFDNQVLILLAYSEEPGNSASASGPKRTYAIAQISFEHSIAEVKDFDILVRNKERDARPSTTPKMSLIDGGAAVLIHFGDAITVASLSDGATFRDTLSLKSSWDRTLGFGHVKPAGEEAGSISEIAVLTAQSGVLVFRVDEVKIKDFHPETPTNQIKSTLEQAIFFGAMNENPFSFSLSPPFEGSLDNAASSLSQEILGSRSEFMRPILDLRAQLRDRQDLLWRLIMFINENGVAGQLSISARKSLSVDAEKLAAASHLWTSLNQHPGSRSLLMQAIEAYYNSNPSEPFGEDLVRAFFKNKIDHLGFVFSGLHDIVRSSQTRRGSNVSMADVNRIILYIFDTVYRHRNETAKLYSISPDDRIAARVPSWTSDRNQIDILQDFYDATARLLAERGRDANITTVSNDARVAEVLDLQQQLSDLASALFYVYRERVIHVQEMAKESGNDREAKELETKFTAARSHVVGPLVLNQGAEHAYGLAEQYKDFRMLVELCNDPRTGSKERVKHFLQKYEDDFASKLYEWYLENGQQQKLLTPDEEHIDMVTRFLKKNPNPRVSWIHYLGIGDMAGAADALFIEAEKETNLLAQQTILSIGKLCEVAMVQDLVNPDISGIDTFDDQLDVVSVQNRVLDQFKKFVQEYRTRPSRQSDVEIIGSEFIATALRERPAFQKLYKSIVKLLLQRQVIPPEDLVDLTTLKRNDELDTNGFMEALDILHRIRYAKVPKNDGSSSQYHSRLPPGRWTTALETVWRRAFIYDDWEGLRETAHLTDDEVSQNLRATALYQLVKHTISIKDFPSTMVLPPSEAARTPPQIEITTRFTSLSASQITDLMADYQWEQRRLDELIEGRVGLEEIYDAIRKIAAEDHAQSSENLVPMEASIIMED